MSEIDRLYEDELGYQAARASELESEVRRLRAELAEEKAHGDRLAEALKELVSIVKIHSENTDNNFAWAEAFDAKNTLSAHEARKR